MTNTALTQRHQQQRHVGTRSSTTCEQPPPCRQPQPPSRPPPPVRARGAPVRQAATRRRAPAVPPPTPERSGAEWQWEFELDPVRQNERNDDIWQRRRRRSASQSPAAAAPSPAACPQCRYVDDAVAAARTEPDFATLRAVSSCALNDYVDEPSTATTTVADGGGDGVPPDSHAVTSSSSSTTQPPPLALRLSDHAALKCGGGGSSKDGSATSLRAAVAAGKDRGGFTCPRCGGCRCASCRGDRGGGGCVVRTVLGVCVPCMWAVAACRRNCAGAPDPCRCRTDSSL